MWKILKNNSLKAMLLLPVLGLWLKVQGQKVSDCRDTVGQLRKCFVHLFAHAGGFQRESGGRARSTGPGSGRRRPEIVSSSNQGPRIFTFTVSPSGVLSAPGAGAL